MSVQVRDVLLIAAFVAGSIFAACWTAGLDGFSCWLLGASGILMARLAWRRLAVSS